MSVAIAKIACHQHHGGIEQRCAPFLGSLQLVEQAAKGLNQLDFNLTALRKLFGFLAMMRKIMMHAEGHKADGAGGIRDQCEVDHVYHKLELCLLLLAICNVSRFATDCLRLGLIHPLACHFELAFYIAYGLKVFVDALAVGTADLTVEALGSILYEIEHAASFIDTAQVGFHLGGSCSQKKLFKYCRGAIHRRNRDTIGGDRK